MNPRLQTITTPITPTTNDNGNINDVIIPPLQYSNNDVTNDERRK